MFDPDNIITTENNLANVIKIISPEIDNCNIICYCLEDDKEFEKYIRDVESQVRRSFEYKEFIKYIRENYAMDTDAFLKDVSNRDTFGIKIEIHHYPFTLRDIVEIVVRKRKYYNESVELQMVAKEVMELHYKLMVGLIPLSQTVHELAHNGKIFIPVDKVLGRYDLFVTLYKPFCDTQQLETLSRIEKYTEEQQNPVLNTTIIQQNHLKFEINDSSFKLPDSESINVSMLEQMAKIKENNYMLPSITEIKEIEEKLESPIRFIDKTNKNIGFFGESTL